MMSRKWMVVPVLVLAACGSASENAAAVENSTPADAPSPPALAAEGGSTGSMIAAPDAALLPTRGAGDVTRASSLPADVVAFRQRRDECDHFRGEEPYDAKRAAFLRAALARTCKGTDSELAALRKRYVRDPAVLRALADYEPNIEPPKDDL